MKTKFYAICNNVGICTINDDHYKSCKALFSNKEDAIKMLNRNSEDKDLRIDEVYIAVWDE